MRTYYNTHVCVHACMYVDNRVMYNMFVGGSRLFVVALVLSDLYEFTLENVNRVPSKLPTF